jgi:hypothetical protein
LNVERLPLSNEKALSEYSNLLNFGDPAGTSRYRFLMADCLKSQAIIEKMYSHQRDKLLVPAGLANKKGLSEYSNLLNLRDPAGTSRYRFLMADCFSSQVIIEKMYSHQRDKLLVPAGLANKKGLSEYSNLLNLRDPAGTRTLDLLIKSQ